MSATQTAATPIGARVRNAAVGAIFALVLVVPKLLHLRRNKHSWFAFRIVLAIVGAALVILPLSLWNSLLAAIAGLAMFIVAILLLSTTPVNHISEKAAEFGALVVVNGGDYQAAASRAAVQLLVGAEKIWALDSQLQPLLVIPVSEISSVGASEMAGQWTLRILSIDQTADFFYRGGFAEHLARVAETTIRSVMHPALPVLAQKRAARA